MLDIPRDVSSKMERTKGRSRNNHEQGVAEAVAAPTETSVIEYQTESAIRF